ncbi:MAG: hypothetical protein JNN03_03715 [Rubrivivax sp.]|nr:hypothetical protein [Rubrivivax sp.]
MLFFWGWRRVLAATPDFAQLRLLMLGAAVVVPVVTISWILHNRGIHRRKGPRRHVATARLEYGVDFNGRRIVADFRALAQARHVQIVVEGARKEYLVEATDPPRDGARGAAGTHEVRVGRLDVAERASHRATAPAGSEEPSSSGDRDAPTTP